MIVSTKPYFVIDRNEEIDLEKLGQFINEHRANQQIYTRLMNMYISKYDIFNQKEKEKGKPDNRVAVNFAKYITDSFNGFFMGIPVQITHENEKTNELIRLHNAINDSDDLNAEISKYCDIYGHVFEIVYIENGFFKSSIIPPTNAFIIYDNTVSQSKKYGVMYYIDTDGTLRGSYSDDIYIYYFKMGKDGLELDTEKEQELHGFSDIPVIEFYENNERMGIFESSISLINAYNKAISEKTNDVDYFADAYLWIDGVKINKQNAYLLKDDRIINTFNKNPGQVNSTQVKFLEKPNADEAQENLLDRLERLIFQISMVTNINDENFGSASGISLRYKMETMDNLARVKERKFKTSLLKRYELMGDLKISPVGDLMKGNALQNMEWLKLNFKFTRNIPANIKEKAEVISLIKDIISNEGALEYIGEDVVQDLDKEKERKREQVESHLGSLDIDNQINLIDEEIKSLSEED